MLFPAVKRLNLREYSCSVLLRLKHCNLFVDGINSRILQVDLKGYKSLEGLWIMHTSAGREQEINALGKQFFASIKEEKPSVFNTSWWTGKVMDLSMRNEEFKVQMFRFVDVLPYLNSSDTLTRHIDEYFADESNNLPGILKWGAKGLSVGGNLAAGLFSKTLRYNIETMAQSFMAGRNASETIKCIKNMRKKGFAFTLDVLGEATLSEKESDEYLNTYLEMLDSLDREQAGWASLCSENDLDWGYAPRINVSVKPSALYSQASPTDFEGTVQHICNQLEKIYRKVISVKGSLCIDMEQKKYKDIVIEVFRRLRSSPEFKDYPHLSVVLQSYLKCTDGDLKELIEWAKTSNLPISIRLVKGAYWDYETIVAKQNDWEIPVYSQKPQSDVAFERHARIILDNHEICTLACASHNIRSIAAVLQYAKEINVPEEKYEFQVLYGMAEPVRKGLLNITRRVRLYTPFGDLIPGMAYLVRRLLENTANESFLRQSFVEEQEAETLLQDPQNLVKNDEIREETKTETALPSFTNHPSADFTVPGLRDAFPKAIADARAQLGRIYPLVIGGRNVKTDDIISSVNPANPDEVVGKICQAGVPEIDQAIEAAETAFKSWREVSAVERAQYLVKAAEVARKEICEMCAWQILEVGKQWDQAYADVAEAIDFLEYYAREAIRLDKPRRMGDVPGEANDLFYEPKGIAAVIAPWNFPLAISCGMASAAIAAGNSVIYKPAGPSSVVGYGLARLFEKAGLPKGVFNFTPGRGRVIGDYLVEHPKVNLIAFTGSRDVGLRILNRASVVGPNQVHIKKVICELGGKNAIIVDDDADLDEAVAGIIYSAFGFQGQKCSACSRVIVLDSIHDRFIQRLRDAAASVKIGPAEDPSCKMGPVVDEAAYRGVMEYVSLAEKEGQIILKTAVPGKGYYVPMTIVTGITPEHRIAQEEIFGPVLAVMRAKDLDQAIEWANSTQYALTGAVFSRSPANIKRLRKEFRVGNLYINRGSTGALVERQPFGGFKLSGTGPKAGGPDCLLQFMDARVVTENTMRRGFAPDL